jgi:ATP-binding cassette subfamily F protein 3
MIKLQQLSFMRGPEELLAPCSLDIFPGQKCAIIGANGCGKSSLFAMFAKQLMPETGELSVPKQWRMVSVAQHTPQTDATVLDFTISGDQHLLALRQDLKDAEARDDGERIAQLHDDLAAAGHYDVEARAATILAGLGFSQAALNQSVNDFSGGWKMRMNLAQALLCPSDLLLLDEPTNHLDLDAVIWLEKWLQRYTGTLLFISHDKHFIDAIAGQIISFEQRQLIAYTGNYSAYERQKAERMRLQGLEYKKQQGQIAHLEKFITRFKAKASKAKQAQSRVKQLERMQLIAPVQADNPFSFDFLPPAALPNPLVQMRDVEVGYGEKVVLHSVQLNLVPGSRIGLLGRNGAGKSTLIKLLANVHGPIQGEFTTAQGLDIGYFAQHQVDTLDPKASPLLHLQRLDKLATEQSLRDFLGGFGFQGDQATREVAPFSGGEKARLALAMIVYQKPNLLLLDEPTNHLDLGMRDALNFALQSFTGAMVLVAHDRTLLESVCEDFYLVDSGQVEPFAGDLDDYTKWVLDEAKQDKISSQSAVTESDSVLVTKPSVDRKLQKRLEASFRQATKAVRERIAKAEKHMQTQQAQLANIETQLSDPDMYSDAQKSALKTLLAQQVDAQRELAQAEEDWFVAQDELEQAQADFEQQWQSEASS